MTIVTEIILFTILGFAAGCALTFYLYEKRRIPDGYFFVNLTNPEDEMFKMQIDIPLEELPNANNLIFKVKKIQ